VGASVQWVRVFSGCECSVGASVQWVRLFSGCESSMLVPRVPVFSECQFSVRVSFEFWENSQSRQCRGDASSAGGHASTGLCAVERLCAVEHSTRNRTPAPAHRLSSVSPINCANLLESKIFCAALNDRDLSSFSHPWPVKCGGCCTSLAN
jgi:hypothetical protein